MEVLVTEVGIQLIGIQHRGGIHSLESTRNANAFLFVFLKCNHLPLEVSEVCGIVMKRRNSFILFYTFPALVPLCSNISLVNTVGYLCLDKWN